MHADQLLTLIICMAVFIPIFIYSFRATRAFRTYRLLLDGRAGCCEEIGFVGFSAICSGISSLERIEELLSVEYSRYELIVVLDRERYALQTEQIISRYKLVRMNTIESIARDVVPRALYRSRQRSLRRVVLVDVAYRDEYNDYNCGAAVASYDFLLPLGPSSHLFSNAIEVLAIALSEQEQRGDLFGLDQTAPFYLFRRDRVVAAGGFSEDIVYNSIFENVSDIQAQIVYQREGKGVSDGRFMFYMIICIVLLISVLWGFVGVVSSLVVGSTLLSVLSLAAYENQLYDGAKSLKMTMLCYIRYIVSFFYRRKFHLS